MWIPLVLFVILASALLFLGRDPREYDERQRLAQGAAYKAAFYTLLLWLGIVSTIQELRGVHWFSPFALFVTGMCLAFCVLAVLCIWKDAYNPVGYRSWRFYLSAGVLLLCELLQLFSHPLLPLVDNDGTVTGGLLHLCLCAVPVVILAAYTLKLLGCRVHGDAE